MIRLGLHHLAVIQGLGQSGSVSATARLLGLTQSAVSHRMKEAERRTGSLLFSKSGHVIALTQAGRRLLQSAEAILAEMALAERDLDRLSSGFQETLRIGGACYAGFGWFPDLYRQMRESRPHAAVEIVSAVSEDPGDLLVNNVADIVLAAGRVEKAQIHCEVLASDQLVAVLPPDHELSRHSFLDPIRVTDFPYVTHHTLPEDGREYDMIFKPLKVMPSNVICAGRTQAVLELVAAGEGITILPEKAVSVQAGYMGLRLQSVTKKGISVHWHALIRRTCMDNELILKGIDLLKTHLNRS